MANNNQSKLNKELREKMSEIKIESEEGITQALAKKFKLPYTNLQNYPINPRVLIIIDEKEARSAQVAVISKTEKVLKIAVYDPNGVKTKAIVENLRQKGFFVSVLVASLGSLNKAWEKYKIVQKIKAVDLGVIDIDEKRIIELQEKIESIKDLKTNIPNLRVTEILDMLLAGAMKIKASDIHIELEEKNVRIRYRIDGLLSDVSYFPAKNHSKLLSRIKLRAGLKINIHDTPQDGRFTVRLHDRNIEVRVSVIPGAYGESVVMRVLDPKIIQQKLEDLGMREDTLKIVREELKKTAGAFLTTGPAGSGKTTTLYAFAKV